MRNQCHADETFLKLQKLQNKKFLLTKNNKIRNMLRMSEVLMRAVRASILSTRVSCPDTNPVSLFIVAPFESGKTTMVLRNIGDEQLVLTDITGMGLLEALQQNQKASTVVINDLTSVTGHRGNVPKLTIAVLNALAEEGVYKIAVPRMAHLDLKGRRVNVISCLVPELLSDKRNWWHKSGFLSRMLVLKYKHSIQMNISIHEHISNGTSSSLLQGNKLYVPEKQVRVSIPPEQSYQIKNLARSVASLEHELGYRKHKHLRALACGNALLRSWKKASVEDEDVQFLNEVLKFALSEVAI